MELDREMRRVASVARRVPSLATVSARSLPGIEEWPGIHWTKIEDEMELMELQMEIVRGCEDMSASHKDLLSVQKSTVNE